MAGANKEESMSVEECGRGALERILVVDDDRLMQAIIRLVLAVNDHFIVQACHSGAEALTVASTWHPDLIMLDVHMPGIDGWQTLAMLRSKPETTSIPVIFLTASELPTGFEDYRSMGVLGFIPKPFDPMTFSGHVRELWAAPSA
jgi:CheY-like chemotaxis protein